MIRFEVFDEDYIPERILFREKQMERIAGNLTPILYNSRPINMLCLGTVATGKTTVVKYITSQIDALTVYVNCQLNRSKQQVFLKIFEKLYNFTPPRGVSFQKVLMKILKKIVEDNKILLLILDDLNFMDDENVKDIINTILKAHEEVDGFKAGVIGVANDVGYVSRLSDLSLFHPDEIFFPPYDRGEIEVIIRDRIRLAFGFDAISDEALNKIVDETFKYSDLRYGMNLLKLSALRSYKNGRDKIELDDVIDSIGDSMTSFSRKALKALSNEEIDVLKAIYTSDVEKTSDLYSLINTKIRNMSYTKFYEILRKLESLRFIDTISKFERGLQRIVVRRFEANHVLKAISEM